MKKLLLEAIFIVLCIFISGCVRYDEKKLIEIMSSSPVNMNLAHMECWQNDSLLECRPWEKIPLKLCVYVSSDNCTSCYLKRMFQWEDFIEMEKGGVFYIYFIFTPQDGCEETFHKFFFQAELDHPFYLDKNKEFLSLNPQIPQEQMFHTFLLDENNNVILIGDILHNPKVEEEFKCILEERGRLKAEQQ